jgi:histidyl-tRNA synthetase
MYRYGRPQKGRYREFWQLDLEAIGSDDPAVDAEVIQLYDALLGRLGVTDYSLELNSIGDPNCRPAYLEDQLKPWLAEHEAGLDEATREQAQRNPLRALDNIGAKPPETQALLRQAPAIGDSLCDACREHFADVRRYLDAFGVGYEVVPTLVRGLDYYTRTTWEFVGPEGGAQSTLSGGGRYDGLAEALGGAHTPGVGFGAGIERLLLALEGMPEPEKEGIDIFFAAISTDRAPLLKVMMDLRAKGYRCDADFAARSMKGQLTQFRRTGARVLVTAHGPHGPQINVEVAGETFPLVSLDDLEQRILDALA